MAPETMIAAAMASGSPALQVLVLGHLAAGRPGMAMLALHLPREALAELDAALADGMAQADALALLAAVLAAGGTDGRDRRSGAAMIGSST